MKRLAPLALLVFAALAHGQMVECKPPPTCDAGVVFRPSAQDVEGGQSPWLDPATPPNPLLLQLKPIAHQALAGTVELTGWTDPGAVEVEARFVLHNRSGDERSAWTPLTATPMSFVENLSERADVDVEYRARVHGDAPAGEHTTDVVYHVWDGRNGPDHKDSVSHPLRVIVPAYLTLRLSGLPAGAEAWVSFDFSGSNAAAFARALDTGLPAAPTGASFDGIEVATNAANGFNVIASVTAVADAGGRLDPERLLVRGATLDGEVVSGTGPTQGFAPVLYVGDLRLRVDGAMDPGEYRYVVRFDAVARP